MSKLEHFVLRFVFPLLYAAGSSAFLVAACLCRVDHLFASLLFTICGLWLGFWALAMATVAFVPSIWEVERVPLETLRQIERW